MTARTSPDAGPAVLATGLTKRYGSITAVDNVDLRVQRGDVYGLLGPNGAGKTTFMRMLFGLVRPDSGRIQVLGRSVEQEGVAALQQVAGFVETPRFYPYLTGRTNLELLAALDGDRARSRVDEVLERVGLSDRSGSRVREYSYGMVQRLGVAASLMRQPDLLVLDEPTNGLDPAGIRDMRGLIKELSASGLTVLLSSHIMAEVEDVCNRVAIMRRGHVAFDGSISDLRARRVSVPYLLDTSDNKAALDVCVHTRGIDDPRPVGQVIGFSAEQSHVEVLSAALVDAGVGIRSLCATTSALETVFFQLTAEASAGERVAPAGARP